ncbi:hypothetical protein GQ602_000179 [Ophiocordyceps camponoti-floridani]|uniref:Invertebrate defensins family profile domain-containing protein n=1 Tax=Ophiocordyceps camponoti-floridani TaxID=2030778 RepID=A0A8H4QBN1_9HYPO|nr:hypothetical protein GQ602_000179 [Ophiocordyceps camponoti-floridani]
MKAPSLLTLTLLLSPAAARWILDKRSSCQACAVGNFNAADACCSLSCAAQHKNKHGGHCNENKVCVCN